jgi:chemotaxis protein MotB
MAKRKKKEKREDEHISESWLIPYADLLTLLLALFIVLFSMGSDDVQKANAIFQSLNNALNTFIIFDSSGEEPNNSNQQNSDTKTGTDEKKENKDEKNTGTPPKGISANDKEEQKLQDLMTNLEDHIEQNNLDGEMNLTNITEGIQITLKDRIVFDSGSDHIKDNFIPILDEITKLLMKLDNPIIIEGHTDNRPIHNSRFPSNWELSGARAAAVLHYFQNHGIDPTRMRFTGYGEYQPIAPNDTPENREANRRVNIIVLRK